jgi:ribonuclease R
VARGIRKLTGPELVVLEVRRIDGDGDLIAVPLDWHDDGTGLPEVLLSTRAIEGPAPAIGDQIMAKLKPARRSETGGPRFLGRMVRRVDRQKTVGVGIFRIGPLGGQIDTIDKRDIGRSWRVRESDTKAAGEGEIVGFDILSKGRHGEALARVTERFGTLGTEKAVSELALISHSIPHRFPDAVLRDADRAKPLSLEGREDWRSLPLLTIDPADAKDHDDAVHAAPDTSDANPGGFIVHVAIADVAAYVRSGSALDQEAVLRGNSVYFPDRVVPMLPEQLSNELCSLKPGVDRPAIALRLVIDAAGRTRDRSFHRIMMRSAAKLSYQQAQAAIDGQTDDVTEPLLVPVLRPLWAAYNALEIARDERGPLQLDLPERKILLKEDGSVDRVLVPERLAAHRLIEEFMIRANVAAAEVCEDKRTPLIYRVHESPTVEKLHGLREVLSSLDINLPKQGTIRPGQFNGILARVKGSDVEPLVNEMVLRSQAQAAYAPDNVGHFGLSLRRYAHFTSPIRRYADLVVHRALIRACKLGDDGLGDSEMAGLSAVARDISVAERRAMAAERETSDRLIAAFLATRVGATFSGRISGVVKSGLFVKLDETGADGYVPAGTLGRQYFAYDELKAALVGERTGETFRLGDSVEVKLVDARPVQGALTFEMLSEGRSGKPLRRGRPGRTPHGGARRDFRRTGPGKRR